MGLGPEAIQVGAWNVGKSNGKKKKDCEAEGPGCWIKLWFMGSCLSPRSKGDGSISVSSSLYAESKSTNDTSRDQPVLPVVSTSTTSTAESTPSTPNVGEELKVASQLRKFSYNELKSATRNFRPESLLGEGGFGCVFKGWINENGTAPVKPGTGLSVAVKTLNHDGLQGHKEWLAEVNYLSDLLHPNLVKLIGYCIEDDQRLLVYEFMPRGSLENHLFRSEGNNGSSGNNGSREISPLTMTTTTVSNSSSRSNPSERKMVRKRMAPEVADYHQFPCRSLPLKNVVGCSFLATTTAGNGVGNGDNR
ncbi:hypothetical protein SLEP1_g10335 [Rubroshorea leprosula]|uniref:non-specific serine/threonine protein kinase n=1 Tax=Rubroshorea leprosula TaxID=152421 RepID=A0AAV5IH86_9ROSI|nr:hypothetical protein SLEP1_g10335 [Rubroshorea leprosula]